MCTDFRGPPCRLTVLKRTALLDTTIFITSMADAQTPESSSLNPLTRLQPTPQQLLVTIMLYFNSTNNN